MSTHKWTPRLLIRYALFQLPELALLIVILLVIQRWVALPAWLFWGAIAIWAVKDVLLYPLVWQSYDPDQPQSVMPLVGAKGIAKERLAPTGYIQVHGVLWKAQLMKGCSPVAEGEAVQINERRGLTLWVQPWDEVDKKG
jgi:membrane protein implicated in regulation of membrane protease activity